MPTTTHRVVHSSRRELRLAYKLTCRWCGQHRHHLVQYTWTDAAGRKLAEGVICRACDEVMSSPWPPP